MLGRSISKNSLILGLFAAATAAIIAGTFQLTQTRIAAEEKKAASAALIDMVPKSRHNNDMLEDTLTLDLETSKSLGLTQPAIVHIAKQDNQPVALVIPSVAPDGYSGDIKLIIAINIDGTIAGSRVLAHKETPGLGDKIDLRKSDWIKSFDGKSLNNPKIEKWKVKKDGGIFDQFTGATITPRAVVNRIQKTLAIFQDNRDQWLKMAEATHE